MSGLPDELVHYIRAGGAVAIFTKTDDANPATDRTRYLHKDHLGSIGMITGEAGLLAETRSFDAWGRARNADWTAAIGDLPLAETKRGFTGHEHIDAVGLIHMNGRVYDPELGRFLSADPIVQFANVAQSHNRYGYVLNNPLSYTDPSGFGLLGKVFDLIRTGYKYIYPLNWYAQQVAMRNPTVAAIAQVVAMGVATFYCGPCAIGVAAAFSAEQTAMAGGSMTDILIAAGTSAVFAAITYQIGGAFAQIASPYIGKNYIPDRTARTIAAAVAGGIGAELGGGKFRNGAITGAFQRLLNDEQHPTPGIGHNSGKGFWNGLFRVIGRIGSVFTWPLSLCGDSPTSCQNPNLTDPAVFLEDPSLLAGKTPAEVEAMLGNQPGWRVETLGRGTHEGQGWAYREYNGWSGEPTGRMIRWHPGGGRHGPEPYWRTMDGVYGKSGEIR